MEISEQLDRVEAKRPDLEAGPVTAAVKRLAAAIDRLAVTEGFLRERLAPVLGPQGPERLLEALAGDREEPAPLARDLDDLCARIHEIHEHVTATAERLHL